MPGCGGLQYAHAHGITTVISPPPRRGEAAGAVGSDELLQVLLSHDVDIVLLAGYLKVPP